MTDMNVVVDYETMAEGLKKALSSTRKAYKERMKWQIQDITISIETNPTLQSE